MAFRRGHCRWIVVFAVLVFDLGAGDGQTPQTPIRPPAPIERFDPVPTVPSITGTIPILPPAKSEGAKPPGGEASGGENTSKEGGANKESGQTKEGESEKGAGKPKESEADKKAEQPKEKKWYDKLSLRGYTQIRSNETIWRRDGTAESTLVGDRAVGPNQNFSIRRARLILSGDVSEHLFLYVQPDLAVTPPGSTDGTLFLQMRDLYGDVYLTRDKVHRLRVGLSKVPFGFDNLQSSSNRLPFDRTDPINSAVSQNERDLGVFYYWTPEPQQDLFKRLVDDGLKGSGNYGVFGLGVYNGQGGGFLEQNDNLHAVVRLTYPFELPSGQIVEFSTQAYTGKYTVRSAPIRPLGIGPSYLPANTLDTGGRRGLIDERVGWTAVWYPQPLGFQAEWTIGRGPALTDEQTAVVVRRLDGGYLMTYYRLDTPCYGTFFPYVQWAYYRGGYRSERNAPYTRVNEWHIGCEWQISKALEFTVQYTNTDRTNTTPADRAGERSYDQFVGGLLRFQLQLNY